MVDCLEITWPFAKGESNKIAANEKVIMGLSVDMIKPPSALTGRLIQIAAAQRPVDLLPACRPISNIMTAIIACMMGAKARTPNSEDPKIVVLRPINQAIIGGLVKYPASGCVLHCQYWASSTSNPKGDKAMAINRVINSAATISKIA